MSAVVEESLRGALGPAPLALPPDGDRPLVDLELPLGLGRLVTRKRLAGFKRAAVLVPLLRRDDGFRVLLTRRADHLRAHRGQVSFPGGRFEPDDGHLITTALRETEEEIALPRDRIEVIGSLDDYPTLTRYLITPVVGVVADPPELRADRNEVADIFEIPLDHLLDPASFRRRIGEKDGMRVPFYEIDYGAHRVWGATAGMLWNMHNKLRA
ncbi:CoA pyrophosphatase [Algiphilus sp.]|uniref:CoA pyrophosphatase n=1 Tax=Algiphilus sp. TaxID=1872431 RepID=UPI0025BD0370|nr:CoA pyrophosphatase [Algiphilus sp.]MCK5770805.1 CoA pyrophosphatase [Algiphilus sp.]